MNQKLDKNQVMGVYLSESKTSDIADLYNISVTTVNDIKGKRVYTEFLEEFDCPPGRYPHTNRQIFDSDTVRDIFYFSGTAQEIKEKFGCTARVARNIKFGKTYQDITEKLDGAGEIKIYGLTWDEICDIRASDIQVPSLARRYKVSPETIRNIKANRTRKYI